MLSNTFSARPLLSRFFGQAETILRGEASVQADAQAGASLRFLFACVVVFGICYGAVMGSFGGIAGERVWQMVYSAIKVPLLLLVTFALSLPSLFIFNTLLGLRSDFAAALRALVASQAGLTILLASLAPLTLMWNVSATGHQATILFNALMFGVATLGGQKLLRHYYRPLLARDPRHVWLLRIWGVVYTFVGIQMGWILRPFVGDPDRAVRFFREDTWGNAYVILFQLLRHVFRS